MEVHGRFKRQPCNQTKQSDAEILLSLWPAYNVVFPAVLAVGIAGNVMNLIVLTRPSLRGVTYVYLTGLAIADLGVMITALPTVLRFNVHIDLSYFSAIYHAFIELMLTNSFMASSIFIVCFMTLDRYFSVCRPSEFKQFHTRRNAVLAITVSYLMGFIISCPLVGLKTPCKMNFTCSNNTKAPEVYSFQENKDVTHTTAWLIYLWISEQVMRIFPAIHLGILNCLIIYSFRKLARHQRKLRSSNNRYRNRSNTTDRHNAIRYRMHLEEERLIILLTGIIVTFYITMTPAVVLSLIYSDKWDAHYGFQVFRATANILEISNYALNFFIYCLCSLQFRQTLRSIFSFEKLPKDDIKELDTTKNGTSASR